MDKLITLALVAFVAFIIYSAATGNWQLFDMIAKAICKILGG